MSDRDRIADQRETPSPVRVEAFSAGVFAFVLTLVRPYLSVAMYALLLFYYALPGPSVIRWNDGSTGTQTQMSLIRTGEPASCDNGFDSPPAWCPVAFRMPTHPPAVQPTPACSASRSVWLVSRLPLSPILSAL